jgi:hypothetical protein
VVNDQAIYECREKEPVIIPAANPVTKIFITNGFHSSRVVMVKNIPGVQLFEVEGFIDNIQLITGFLMTLLFFLIYIFSGIRLFMLFANIPLLMMLYVLYVKRRHFILIHVLKPLKTKGQG